MRPHPLIPAKTELPGIVAFTKECAGLGVSIEENKAERNRREQMKKMAEMELIRGAVYYALKARKKPEEVCIEAGLLAPEVYDLEVRLVNG